MPITVMQNRSNGTVITIVGKVDAATMERATRDLRYLGLTGGLKSGTQAQVDELTRSPERGMADYNS
jgi:hypothetical protein